MQRVIGSSMGTLLRKCPQMISHRICFSPFPWLDTDKHLFFGGFFVPATPGLKKSEDVFMMLFILIVEKNKTGGQLRAHLLKKNKLEAFSLPLKQRLQYTHY